MKLRHYSYNIVKSVYSVEQDESDGRFYEKPSGFWVSCDDYELSWPEWCQIADFGGQNLENVHDVELIDNHNVLILKSAEDIDQFTEKYGKQSDIYQYLKSTSLISIDWVKVAKEYSGLIIAPYIHERRLSLHTSWYYGWDCASGCIWNASVIKSIKLTENQLLLKD